ncbi:MAG: DNA polymerase III subunit delta [Deltaproteobacteria bacterium]|nr:DNA polymerase III subunit delta [Deltaproteobacteria bacterium]
MEGKKHSLVRYFYGEEWLVREAIQKETDLALPSGFRDFNLEVLDAEVLTVESFWRSVQSLPMGTSHRVVWIQRADRLKSILLEELTRYAGSPQPHTLLILSGEKPDLRLRFFQGLRRGQGLVELSSLKGGEVVAWLSCQAEKLGKRMSREAAQLLVEEVGSHLRLLQNELEKLILFVGDRVSIEEKDVEPLVTSIPRESIFVLVDAVAMKDRSRAIAVSEEVLEQGVHPLQILTLMERQFRLLSRAQELRARSIPRTQWPTELGIPPFVVSKLEEQLQKFGSGFSEDALSLCFEADLRMKSSRVSPKLALEYLLLELGR